MPLEMYTFFELTVEKRMVRVASWEILSHCNKVIIIFIRLKYFALFCLYFKP
jgi:hypothetical protein